MFSAPGHFLAAVSRRPLILRREQRQTQLGRRRASGSVLSGRL